MADYMTKTKTKAKTVFLILMVCANIFLSISCPEDGVL